MIIFYSFLWKYDCMTVATILWKSDNPVSVAHDLLKIYTFLWEKLFCKKTNLKNPLKNVKENLQRQAPELRFLKTLILLKAL